MSDSVPIRYLGFWDVPRIFLTYYKGQLFLFDCRFDEGLDDYPDTYQVYLMPPVSDEELAGSWANLYLKALRHIGEVPIDRVCFDETKRKTIDPSIIDELAAKAVVS